MQSIIADDVVDVQLWSGVGLDEERDFIIDGNHFIDFVNRKKKVCSLFFLFSHKFELILFNQNLFSHEFSKVIFFHKKYHFLAKI